MGTPLFDLPVGRGDVPVSPFPPEIARGYRLPGATCLDPRLNPGLLFLLEPLDGGRHLRPDALSFLVGSESVIVVTEVMDQRIDSRAKAGCYYFSVKEQKCIAEIPRKMCSVFICVPSVAILKHQKLRQSIYADSCESFGVSLVEGLRHDHIVLRVQVVDVGCRVAVYVHGRDLSMPARAAKISIPLRIHAVPIASKGGRHP